MSNQQPQKFNFKTISIVLTAIVGVALMLLGRFIIQGTASTLWVNNFINADAFLSVMNCELALSLIVRSVGVGLFVYSMYRIYVTRQSFTFKAFKKTLVLSSLLCLVVIMGSTLVEAPLVAADKVNTISQGYKICTSMSFYDFWIGKLSDNTYFAMRGSDGNVLTFVEPWQATAPWAAYASNYTALEQQVFASISYGTVYSKEVPLNYALTIPQNITFIESVNGLDRRFISSLSSQGSPYTVSVDTVNSGYYLAQDSAGRYIVSWSSTNATAVFSSVLAVNPPSVYVKCGNYSAVLSVPAGTYLQAENGTTGLSYASIGNGAKINEPTFNSQFGAYDHGTYTIVTNSTNYLAFKADNSIWYFSSSLISGTAQPAQNTMTSAGIIYFKGFFQDAAECQFNITKNGVVIEGDGGYHGVNGLQAKSTMPYGQAMIYISTGVEVATVKTMGLDLQGKSYGIIDDGQETRLSDLQIAYFNTSGVYSTHGFMQASRVRVDYSNYYNYATGFKLTGYGASLTSCSAGAIKYVALYISGANTTVIDFTAQYNTAGCVGILTTGDTNTCIIASRNESTWITSYP